MSKSSHPALRDLLYFDRDRAESIYSQFYGGLLREVEKRTTSESEASSQIRLKIKALEGELGDITRRGASRTEASVLHHALLVEAERLCFSLGVAVDVNERFSQIASPSPEELRAVLSTYSYLRVEGQAAFEDFVRMKEIAKSFNELLEFIGRSAAGDALELVPQFQTLQRELQQHAVIAQASEGRKKAEAVSRFLQSQQQVRELIFTASGLTPIPDWLVEAIELWIDLFMPNRLSLRIYPFLARPEFQVICNLKRDAFVNDDLDTIRLAYGSYPDVDLTVFGLVTSLPPLGEIKFRPLPEFADDEGDPDAEQEDMVPADTSPRDGDPEPATSESDEEDDRRARREFERAFRGVFGAAEGMERFVRFSRFPAVVIQPLAVYRTVRLPEVEPPPAQDSWLRRLWHRVR